MSSLMSLFVVNKETATMTNGDVIANGETERMMNEDIISLTPNNEEHQYNTWKNNVITDQGRILFRDSE